MKKAVNIILVIVVLAIVFIPEAKALLQRGLMQIGLFQPKTEKKIVSDQKFLVQFQHSQTSETISTDDLKGKVVFINFWATWCPPCLAEMPSIVELQNSLKNNDKIAVMIVDVDANSEKSNNLLQKKNWSLNNYSTLNQIPKAWFQGTLPTTIVLDKEGNLVYQNQGLADYTNKDFEKFLLNLASE